MKATSITKKTITFDAQPGERVGLDRDGYCIDSITLRFDGDDSFRAEIIAQIKKVKQLRSEDISEENYIALRRAEETLEVLKMSAIKNLKKYRIKRVFVGYSY